MQLRQPFTVRVQPTVLSLITTKGGLKKQIKVTYNGSYNALSSPVEFFTTLFSRL